MKKLSLILLLIIFSSISAAERISSSLRIGGRSYSADWYVPTGEALGLVFMQHGFTANKSNMQDISEALLDDGMMVLALSSSVTGGNFNLARSIASGFIENSITPPNDIAMPDKLILAGHSAGGLHVAMIGKNLIEGGFENLNGVIMFDPVDAKNGLAQAFSTLEAANVRLLAILANGGPCNSNNNAAGPLAGLNSSFVGIKLTKRSAHLDSFGSNTNWFQRLFCGSPTSRNFDHLQNFTRNWAKDLFTGARAGSGYWGADGEAVQELIESNEAALLK